MLWSAIISIPGLFVIYLVYKVCLQQVVEVEKTHAPFASVPACCFHIDCIRDSLNLFNVFNLMFTFTHTESFLYSGAKLWNDIPLDIGSSPTVLTFKNKLKDYLLH